MYWLIGPALILGLALTGSDGTWFPWANLVGLAIVAGVCFSLKNVRR